MPPAPNTAKVIRKRDPNFPEFMNFAELRSLGLKHLGQLSGKIWTDHNVHDPGVTMLETLIYGLLDLGYRTQLPIEDLLAAPDGQATDFFTPAQILANNPLTILDYRKLLMDIPGVKNAWLEVVDDANLYLENISREDKETVLTLSCEEPPLLPGKEELLDRQKVPLNGLYRVTVEMDLDALRKASNCGNTASFDAAEEEEKLRLTIREVLQSHRNLGEDFTEIKILCREEIGLNLDLELEELASAEAVMVDLRRALEQFLSPAVNFYTLKELLDRGTSLEDAFAGRPYRTTSHGFIDTEELQAIERRTIIHRSDLYHLINAIEGVKRVRKLDFTAYVDGETPTAFLGECTNWSYHACPDCVGVFAESKSTLNFFKGAATIVLNQRELLKISRQKGRAFQKVAYNDPAVLDKLPKTGNFRPDLGDYRSLQLELPTNYRIGDEGVPDDAPLWRKARALQLQSFLLFFDQLLSSYIVQLGHLRDIYSTQPDSLRSPDSRHTFFADRLEGVPRLSQLLRFHAREEQHGWTANSVMAVPFSVPMTDDKLAWLNQRLETEEIDLSFCPPEESTAGLRPFYFASIRQRDATLLQIQRELGQGEYQLDIAGTDCNYYFLLSTSVGGVCLLSRQTFATPNDARQAGEALAFLGGLTDTYRKHNDLRNNVFSFQLTFQERDYHDLLQDLLENEAQYCDRRNTVLDHLLARFGEVFTDFSLLQYEAANAKSGLEDKAAYLSNYAALSSGRGQAFNPCCSSWGTENVSGLEKKSAGLAGFSPVKKRLGNVAIHQYDDELLVIARDAYGAEMLRLETVFTKRTEAEKVAKEWTAQLRKGTGLEVQAQANGSVYNLWMNPDTRLAARHPRAFSREDLAERKRLSILAQFAIAPQAEQVVIHEERYRQELRNYRGEETRRSEALFTSAEEALKNKSAAEFIKTINEQEIVNDVGEEYTLIPLSKEASYLNILPLLPRLGLSTPRYQWEWQTARKWPSLRSVDRYASETAAAAAFAELLLLPTEALRWQASTDQKMWELHHGDERLAEISATNAKGTSSLPFWQETLTLAQQCLFQEKSAVGWSVKAGDIRLDSIALYANRKQAQKARKDAFRHGVSWSVNASVPAETYQIVLSSKKTGVVAQTELLLESKYPAEASLKKLQDAATLDKSAVHPTVTPVFGFRLPAADGESLLRGLRFYRTPLAAWERLVSLPKQLQANSFHLDDEVHYSFILMDKADDMLAIHPRNYDNEEERDAALQAGERMLKKKWLNLSQAAWYHYEYSDGGGEVMLVSTQEYKNKGTATKAARQLLPLLAEMDAYRVDAQKGEAVLEISNKKQIIARYPAALATESAAQALAKKLHEDLVDHHYTITSGSYPHTWRLWLPVEDEEGQLRDWWQSTAVFETEEEARETLKRYYSPFEQADQQKYWTFTGKEEEVTIANEQQSAFLEHRYAYAGKQAPAEQLCDDWIMPTKNAQSGRFSYRLVKRDEPLAFHPNSQGEQDINILRERLCARGVDDYELLEICQGPNATCLTENGWRYQIKDLTSGQVYLESYATYSSQEEALAAFAEHHLRVIHEASHVCSYATEDQADNECCSDPPRIALSYPEITPTSMVKPTQLLAVVHPEMLEDLAALRQRMQAYPIRLYVDPCQESNCLEEEEYKYYFRLGYREDYDGCDTYPETVWQSFRCYVDLAEARNDFRRFLHLLEQENSCIPWLDEEGYLACWRELKRKDSTCGATHCCGEEEPYEACRNYLTISEVLLEGRGRFKRLEEAWGEPDYLVIASRKYASLEAAQDGIAEIASWLAYDESQEPAKIDCTTPVAQIDACGQLRYYFTAELRGGEDQQATFHTYGGYPDKASAEAGCARLRTYFRDLSQQEPGDVNNAFYRQVRIIRSNACTYRIVLDELDQEQWQVSSNAPVLASGTRGYKSLRAMWEAFGGVDCTTYLQGQIQYLQWAPLEGSWTDQPAIACLVDTGNNNEVLLQSNSPITQEQAQQWLTALSGDADVPLYCRPYVDANGYYRIGLMPVLEDGAEPDNDRFCETRGLTQMLEVASQPGGIQSWYDSAVSAYRFAIVGKDYRLAQYTSDFLTAEACRAVLEEQVSLNTPPGPACCNELTSISIEAVGENADYFRFRILPHGNTTGWESAKEPYFFTQEAALLAAIEVLAYARESHFLQTENRPDGLAPADPLALLWEILDRYELLGQTDVIQAAALCFPFTLRGNGFGFQLYQAEVESSDTWEEGQECPDPCAPPSDEEPSSSYGLVTWQSVSTYATLEEAYCYFLLFCERLQSAENYRCSTDENCGPFQLMLINEDEVFAQHPIPYDRRSDLEAAIERTEACLYPEGMHVLEHILLRPSHVGRQYEETPVLNADECGCLLSIQSNGKCELTWQDEDEIDCATIGVAQDSCAEGGANGHPYLPGTDPYSFWVTVVLPGWGRRFGQQDFRETLQQIIRREAPAHIGLRFMWVNARDMYYFEDNYQPWLQYLSGQTVCDEDFSVCGMVDCLESLECQPPALNSREAVSGQQAALASPVLALNLTDVFLQNFFRPQPTLINLPQFNPVGGVLTLDNWVLPPRTILNPNILPLNILPGFDPSVLSGSIFNLANLGNLFTPPVSVSPIGMAGASKEGIAVPASETGRSRSISEPEEEKEVEATTQLSKAAIKKRIRQRQARIREDVTAIENHYFRRTNIYEQGRWFVQDSQSKWEDYEKLITELLADHEERQNPDYTSAYTTLVHTATAAVMDQLVLKGVAPEEVAKPLRKLLRALQKAGFDRKAIGDYWKGEELNAWINGNTVDNYRKILRR